MKPHVNDLWRLIVDLSHPKHLSVNDGISTSLCSLEYASVDNAVDLILQLGPGTELVKMDLSYAYRMVPVHPHDQPLLRIKWRGITCVDRSLPFGLRSAPKILLLLLILLHGPCIVMVLSFCYIIWMTFCFSVYLTLIEHYRLDSLTPTPLAVWGSQLPST